MTKKYGVTLFGIALFILIINHSAWAPTNWLGRLLHGGNTSEAPPLDPVTSELLAKYEEYIRFSLAEENIPGAAVAIVKGGRVIYSNGFGLKDVQSADSINSATVFRLASLSKGFAPVLLGMLVEEGCLDWDDRVLDHVPDFELRSATQTRQINMRHLLSHTLGLPPHSYDYSLDHGDTYERLVRRLKEVRLSYKPGEMHTYQNVAYSVVGDVVQNLTGESYADLLAHRIFQPLGMFHASTGYDAIMASKNVAYPHKPTEKYYYKTPISDLYYSAVPAAGVNASVDDMAQWLLLLLGHRPDLISNETLDRIFEPQIKLLRGACNCSVWNPDEAYYALGWRVLDKGGQRIILHGGYVNAYRTEIAFDRENDLGIVVLSNGVSRFIGESTAAFFQMHRELQGASGNGHADAVQ